MNEAIELIVILPISIAIVLSTCYMAINEFNNK